MARLTIDGKIYEYPEGTAFEQVALDHTQDKDADVAIVIENGKLKELHKTVTTDADIEFIRTNVRLGNKVYERTAIMLFVKALSDVLGGPTKGKAKVEFRIGKGIYISPQADYEVDDELVLKVSARMNELVSLKMPITKSTESISTAMEIFARQGMMDKVKLFRYRQSSTINMYCIDGYYDYFYGHMFPNTSYIKYFHVMAYEDGFLLLLPDKKTPDKLDMFEPREKLFKELYDSTVLNNKMEVDNVADLNDLICNGKTEEMILVQEALQERRISEIASTIADKQTVKFVMIAGPSSSGKTSFSHRLSIQLMSHGLHPHPIALDNYFVNRDKTPRDEKGDYDFECLEAIDVEQFNKDMLMLLDGEEVELPTFNFITGEREYRGNRLKLNEDDILVIEGIHGLNEKMSYALPEKSKFKIYISALTSLNVDSHNRIATTDGRLLRRMVRDFRTRGASAQRTIHMWSNVRKGEEENIFPFQEGADVMFNSVLLYEIAALKTYAEPILYNIRPDEPEYTEARRLLKFLSYFLSIPSESLPNNSLAREFVGGSCFDV